MTRRPKRRNRPGGGGSGKAQAAGQRGENITTAPGVQADSELVALLAHGIDMEGEHCLMVRDSTGQSGVMVSAEFMAACKAAGERARVVCPHDPASAIHAAVAVLQPPAGGVH